MFNKTYLIHLTPFVIILVTSYSDCALNNYLNTSDHNCISCLCHARTNCYSLQNCAKYSISYDYWIKAGAPMIVDLEDSHQAYRECIMDDNCIINTIMDYYDNYEAKDCVCDGNFDCRDKLSMHLAADEACKPIMKPYHAIRYNTCARRNNLPLLNPNVECIYTNLI